MTTREKDYQELHGRQRERLAEVVRGRCRNVKRRRRLEKDPVEWLAFYLADAYTYEFGQLHLDMIERGLYAIEHGGNTVTGAPRGTGKSAISWGLALFVVCTKPGEFPAVVPWEAKAVRRALRFWKNALCFNARLAEDYPEICGPFVKSKGNSQRLVALTWRDKKKRNTGARLSVSEGLIVLPDCRAVLGSTTINANPRGMNHSTEDGRILRPTLVIIDDPQDKEAANSPTQVREIVERIDSDVLGMGGPGRKIAALMNVTVIKKHDVASHYLQSTEWDAMRIALITSWPKNRKLWDKWNEARLAGEDERDGGKAARKFYKDHKKELLEGFTVSWMERYDRQRKQPDAYFAAMWDFYKMGEAAFMAEMQNDPPSEIGTQYEITVDLITAHVLPLARLQLPETAGVFTGMIDINRIGLHWVVAGFDQLMTAHVPAYGRWPQSGDLWAKNAPELVRKQAIFRGLKALCDAIAGTTFRRGEHRAHPQIVLIDRGFEPDIVHKFCAAAAYPFRVLPSRGYAAHKYSPIKSMLVGKPLEGCHVSQSTSGQFLAFNADLWRETSQRSFLAEVGGPGGCTLHEPMRAKDHEGFAEHVTAERLVNKYETERGPRWEWAHAVGSIWDWGDGLTGCYVAAAAMGLSPSGMPTVQKPKSRRRTRGVSVISM